MPRAANSLVWLSVGFIALGCLNDPKPPEVKSPKEIANPSSLNLGIVKSFKIGGEGGWDYLTMDSNARRVYIARSDRIMVVDIDAGTVVGEVPNTSGVHGVALDLSRKHGFTSNGADSTVTIFDLDTLRETARPSVGDHPDSIVYDPASDRVFTFNAHSRDSTAISAADGKVVGTISLGGKPESAVADGKGTVYVNIEDKSEIVAFDSKELKIKHRWPASPGATVIGIAMDKVKRRLFVTCRNGTMIVMNADDGKILASLPIGTGTDAAGFDPETGLAYSSNGDGTLTVVGEKPGGAYQVLANVPTQSGARTLAVDAKMHQVVLVTARFNRAAPGQRRPPVEPDSFVVLVVGAQPQTAIQSTSPPAQ